MKRLMLVVIPCLILSACSAKNEQASTSTTGDNTRPQTATNGATSETYKADNTGVNKTEKNFTAEQQSNDPKDVKITSELRRAIMDKKGLSVNAQNVKIIANGGKLTLRGPVDSANEKATIDELANSVSGVSSVDDQLELKNKNVATQKGKEVR